MNIKAHAHTDMFLEIPSDSSKTKTLHTFRRSLPAVCKHRSVSWSFERSTWMRRNRPNSKDIRNFSVVSLVLYMLYGSYNVVSRPESRRTSRIDITLMHWRACQYRWRSPYRRYMTTIWHWVTNTRPRSCNQSIGFVVWFPFLLIYFCVLAQVCGSRWMVGVGDERPWANWRV